MDNTEISIIDFLIASRQYPILDVRSPAEYHHAHIPGAISLPLFSDEERKVVGTAYKQEGKEKAVKLGLSYFSPKMVNMIEKVEEIAGLKPFNNNEVNKKTVMVHCWRGGMRSAGVAWLLGLYGFKVMALKGGYKMFRRWAVSRMEMTYPFRIIGGYTGTGKTRILKRLREMGEETIDLEALACHKGSAFGKLGEPAQPSQEMFENRLAMALDAASIGKNIWIEDESRRIGDLNIPPVLFHTLQSMPISFIDVSFDQRLQCIMDGYGSFAGEDLISAVMRIKKKLGPNDTSAVVSDMSKGAIKNAFTVLLKYYDREYAKNMNRMTETNSRSVVKAIMSSSDTFEIAKHLLSSINKG